MLPHAQMRRCSSLQGATLGPPIDFLEGTFGMVLEPGGGAGRGHRTGSGRK